MTGSLVQWPVSRGMHMGGGGGGGEGCTNLSSYTQRRIGINSIHLYRFLEFYDIWDSSRENCTTHIL